MKQIVYVTALPDVTDLTLKDKFWIEIYLDMDEQLDEPTYGFQVWREQVSIEDGKEVPRVSGRFIQGGFITIFLAMVKAIQHVNMLSYGRP